LPLLRCPVCGSGFAEAGRSLRCASGHNYDVAHQGYVNLLPGGARPGTADTAEMVAARETFLAAGHFAGLRDLVCDVAERAVAGARPGAIMEVGAGTGYYLAGVLDRLPGTVGLALDISKFAARRAARAHERVAAVVCDTWATLPVTDESVSLVLDIFAPRNPPEFRRVLRPGGSLLVVTPSPGHLRELVSTLGLVTVDRQKPERLETAMADDFRLTEHVEYEQRLRLSPADAEALAAMGPSAHHLSTQEVTARLAAQGDLVTTTVSVVVTRYAPDG
jgi:23S rRNA (guanine745-N1)-methyltransferase